MTSRIADSWSGGRLASSDTLPQETSPPPHWEWQHGGWFMVARVTGHVSPIHLPESDMAYSAAIWYRDYAADCGGSDDGKKVYAVVAQISRRKAVFKKILDGQRRVDGDGKDAIPGSACPAPEGQRSPIRVSFEPKEWPNRLSPFEAPS
jgi:hypothetical protein